MLKQKKAEIVFFFEKYGLDAAILAFKNGQEFHNHFRDELENRNIKQFFNYSRKPQMNAKIERFNRTIQEDFIDQNLYLLAYDMDEYRTLTQCLILNYH